MKTRGKLDSNFKGRKVLLNILNEIESLLDRRMKAGGNENYNKKGRQKDNINGITEPRKMEMLQICFVTLRWT